MSKPSGWHYGMMVKKRGGSTRGDKVMYLYMEKGGWMSYFIGITIATDAYGRRTGRLGRIDRFRANAYEIDS